MIPNPWVILGVVLAWIASLAAVGYWQHQDGRTVERVAWQGKQNTELTAANAKILALETAARQKEQANAAQLAAIGAQHEKDLADREAQRRTDVAAVRSGALKLRIPGACPVAAGGGAPGAPAASAAGGDGAAAGELPGPIAADLLDLAHDADAAVEQLSSCQAVIRSYLSIGGGN